MFDRAERLRKGYDEREMESTFESMFAHRRRSSVGDPDYWQKRKAWAKKAAQKFLGIEKIKEEKKKQV